MSEQKIKVLKENVNSLAIFFWADFAREVDVFIPKWDCVCLVWVRPYDPAKY